MPRNDMGHLDSCSLIESGTSCAGMTYIRGDPMGRPYIWTGWGACATLVGFANEYFTCTFAVEAFLFQYGMVIAVGADDL